MTFGSEEFREMLRAAVNGEITPNELNDVLYEIIKKYTFDRIRKGFSNGEVNGKKESNTTMIRKIDAEDIAHEVFLAIYKNLDKHIRDMLDNRYDEKESLAYLRGVVYNQCQQFFKKNYKYKYDLDSTDKDNVSSVQTVEHETPEDILEKNERLAESIERIKKIINISCAAPFKPEKILSYLYHRFIFADEKKMNGSSKDTVEYMQYKILFSLKENFVPMFNNIHIRVELEYENVDELSDVVGYDNPTAKGREIFTANEKLVTDWSNRMKTYIYKHKNEIYNVKGMYDSYAK